MFICYIYISFYVLYSLPLFPMIFFISSFSISITDPSSILRREISMEDPIVNSSIHFLPSHLCSSLRVRFPFRTLLLRMVHTRGRTVCRSHRFDSTTLLPTVCHSTVLLNPDIRTEYPLLFLRSKPDFRSRLITTEFQFF